MNYSEKLDKLYNKYVKDFRRKDTTFEMMSIASIIEELEQDDNYSENDKNIICGYLYSRYENAMKKRYEKLNSDEYKNRYGVI